MKNRINNTIHELHVEAAIRKVVGIPAPGSLADVRLTDDQRRQIFAVMQGVDADDVPIKN